MPDETAQEEAMNTNPQDGSRPTVVLVHGAFAESASWNGVIRRLHEQGYTMVAAANPIRSLSGDAEFLASILESIQGSVVLVGHSYGGSVISNAALGKDNVEALVFVGAFAPEEGESIADLAGRRAERGLRATGVEVDPVLVRLLGARQEHPRGGTPFHG
jgi:pimeloyl-ACP methyl ester carboxylesterase